MFIQVREQLGNINVNADDIDPELLQGIEVTQQHFLDASKKCNPSSLRDSVVEVPDVKWDDIGGLEVRGTIPVSARFLVLIQAHADSHIRLDLPHPQTPAHCPEYKTRVEGNDRISSAVCPQIQTIWHHSGKGSPLLRPAGLRENAPGKGHRERMQSELLVHQRSFLLPILPAPSRKSEFRVQQALSSSRSGSEKVRLMCELFSTRCACCCTGPLSRTC